MSYRNFILLNESNINAIDECVNEALLEWKNEWFSEPELFPDGACFYLRMLKLTILK